MVRKVADHGNRSPPKLGQLGVVHLQHIRHDHAEGRHAAFQELQSAAATEAVGAVAVAEGDGGGGGKGVNAEHNTDRSGREGDEARARVRDTQIHQISRVNPVVWRGLLRATMPAPSFLPSLASAMNYQ